MNSNDFMNNEQNKNTYQATRNLNTEIENPEININSAIGINIKDIPESNIAINNIPNNDNINNYFNQNLNANNNINNNNFHMQNEQNSIVNQTNYNPENKMFITNDLLQNNINQTNNMEDNYENIEQNSNESKYQEAKEIYQPTLKEKKKQSSFQIPPELKIMVIIVLILMLFIFVVPYIYDFIKEIELSITT